MIAQSTGPVGLGAPPERVNWDNTPPITLDSATYGLTMVSQGTCDFSIAW